MTRMDIIEAPGATHQTAVQEALGFIEMADRLAREPNVNIDALSRILEMQAKLMPVLAKASYTRAKIALKQDLPIIEKNGEIFVPGRNGEPDSVVAYPLWEDMDEAITPILAAHGFDLAFFPGMTADNKVTLRAVLTHEDGHSEDATAVLPPDQTGGKNNNQAVGSSYRYGKRNATVLLLNIRTKGDDDDGAGTANADGITAEQLNNLRRSVVTAGANEARLCKLLEVDRLDLLPASRVPEATDLIEQFGATS